MHTFQIIYALVRKFSPKPKIDPKKAAENHCTELFGINLLSPTVSLEATIKHVTTRIFVWHFHTYFDITEEEAKNPERNNDGSSGSDSSTSFDFATTELAGNMDINMSPFQYAKRLRNRVNNTIRCLFDLAWIVMSPCICINQIRMHTADIHRPVCISLTDSTTARNRQSRLRHW